MTVESRRTGRDRTRVKAVYHGTALAFCGVAGYWWIMLVVEVRAGRATPAAGVLPIFFSVIAYAAWRLSMSGLKRSLADIDREAAAAADP